MYTMKNPNLAKKISIIFLWIIFSLVSYPFAQNSEVVSNDWKISEWFIIIFTILSGFYLYTLISVYRPVSFNMKNYEILMILGWVIMNFIKISIIPAWSNNIGASWSTFTAIIADIPILLLISAHYEEEGRKWINIQFHYRNEAKGKEKLIFIILQVLLVEMAVFLSLEGGRFIFAFLGVINFYRYHQKYKPTTQDFTNYIRLIFFCCISGSIMGFLISYCYYMGEIRIVWENIIDLILLLNSFSGIIAFYAHFTQLRYYPVEKDDFTAGGKVSNTKICKYCSTPFQKVNVSELIDQGKSFCRYCGTKLYKYEVIQLEEKEMLEEHEKILTDFNKKLIIDIDN